jgi:hypothetical protein
MNIRGDNLTLLDYDISGSFKNSDLIASNSISILLSFKPYNNIDAYFSICKIIVICAVIIYLLNAFNSNITHLIVAPIEKML